MANNPEDNVEEPVEEKSTQAEDLRRGRRLRQLIDFCWEKPSVPLFLILYVTLGWHPALQKMGLEEEPVAMVAPGGRGSINDLRVDVQRLIASDAQLHQEVAGFGVQLQTLQQDVVDLALRHSNAAAGSGSTVAVRP